MAWLQGGREKTSLVLSSHLSTYITWNQWEWCHWLQGEQYFTHRITNSSCGSLYKQEILKYLFPGQRAYTLSSQCQQKNRENHGLLCPQMRRMDHSTGTAIRLCHYLTSSSHLQLKSIPVTPHFGQLNLTKTEPFSGWYLKLYNCFSGWDNSQHCSMWQGAF